MAVATNQTVKRQGRDGKLNARGVAAGVHIYEGTAIFTDANGFATSVKADANTVFLGIAREEIDNTSGTNGEKNVEFWTDGNFELPTSGLAVADIGSDIHASDNYTFTKTATGNPKAGKIVGYVSATVGVFAIKGLGEAA